MSLSRRNCEQCGTRKVIPGRLCAACAWLRHRYGITQPALTAMPGKPPPLPYTGLRESLLAPATLAQSGTCSRCGELMPGMPRLKDLTCLPCRHEEVDKAGPMYRGLPLTRRDEPLKAAKYANMWLMADGSVRFSGTGYTSSFYAAEAYAVCGQGERHQAPDPDCSCGFWVPARKESRLSRWEPWYVQLETEIAGVVLECARDSRDVTPWGWRAQWQRALSVTLSPACAGSQLPGARFAGPCGSTPAHLAAVAVPNSARSASRLLALCQGHAASAAAGGARVIPSPVTWLRHQLQTEIRPGTVTDAAMPDLDALAALTAYQQAVREIADRLVPVATLTMMIAAGDPGVRLGGNHHAVVDTAGVRYTLARRQAGWVVTEITSEKMLAAYTAVEPLITAGLVAPDGTVLPGAAK